MPDSLTAPVHRMLAEGNRVDDIIAELKRLGFNQQQSVLALHRAMTISRGEAELRVQRHAVWK